jgi:hypothetical protein
MRYETHTHMQRDAVFEAAKTFFGEGGLGMKLSVHQGNQIHFFGDGLIWVTVWPAKKGDPIRVDVDTSERDDEAKRFIREVLKAPVAASNLDHG